MIETRWYTIEDDRFELDGEFIECSKWTCKICATINYAPTIDLAHRMAIRHLDEEHNLSNN